MRRLLITPIIMLVIMTISINALAEAKTDIESNLTWRMNYLREVDGNRKLRFESKLPIDMWTKSFANAKNWVQSQSKDLLGKPDADIMNALTSVEIANTIFLNGLSEMQKLVRESASAERNTKLSNIRMGLANARDQLNRTGGALDKLNAASFYLSAKKDAREIVVLMARYVSELLMRIHAWN